MYFNEIEIENYKCFGAKVRLPLKQGINIIVGQNSVGKTSVLEALGTHFTNRPHRGIETYEEIKRGLHARSTVSYDFTLTRGELLDFLFSRKDQNERMHEFPSGSDITSDGEILKNLTEGFGTVSSDEYFKAETMRFRLSKDGAEGQYVVWKAPYDSYVLPAIDRVLINDGFSENVLGFRIQLDRTVRFFEARGSNIGKEGENRSDFVIFLGAPLQGKIYRFEAERKISSECEFTGKTELEPDASNLAEVLQKLNPSQLQTLIDHVKNILPNIHQINVDSLANGKIPIGKIQVWNSADTVQIDELGFSLEECGSGIGPVLAILYIVSRPDPKVILIDEPQTFLHPNAARKLIETIRTIGGHHQIVIATHSPAMVLAAEPSTVSMVTQHGSKSSISELNIDEFRDLQIILAELGGKFSDVFGYDRVIWVEGNTEEICFPKIIRKFGLLMGTAILKVRDTGEFKQKDKKRVSQIMDTYTRLTNANHTMIPSSNDFIFDSDIFSATEMKELKKLGIPLQNRPCVHFLDRPMYENYLLNPEAISKLVNDIDTDRPKPISSTEVRSWIKANRDKTKYMIEKKAGPVGKFPNSNFHGKKFLQDLFNQLIETPGISYEEVRHGEILTEWILENSPNDVKDISKLLQQIIEPTEVNTI